MKQATRNTYSKGLNRDIDKHIPQNEFLYNNENFRLITQEGQSSVLLENVKGNTRFLDSNGTQLQCESGFNIIGHYVFDNKDVVLFAVSDVIGTDNYPVSSRIYLYKYNQTNKIYHPRIFLHSNDNNDWHANANRGFKFKNNIYCIGRTETNFIRGLYWTDGENPLRFLNLVADIDSTTGQPKEGTISADYTRIQNQDIYEFESIGRLSMTSTISFEGYGNGSLNVGKVQYAYRFFNKGGTRTNFIIDPMIIPIPRYYGSYLDVIEGADVGSNSFKSVRLNLYIGNDNTYEYVEIYGIYYYNSGEPTVKILYQLECTDANYVSIVDTGNSYLGTSSIEEITTTEINYIVETIERKDDRLFLGNIEEEYFDVDYDARAYRFNSAGVCKIYDKQVGSTEYIVDPSTWSVPEDHDCINKFNDFSLPTFDTAAYAYKYNQSGVLGGEGPNLSYTFISTDYDIDEPSTDGHSYVKTDQNDSTKENYLLGLYRGFLRDEVYRFGIIFINNKGQQSFVKWIGDIRMPTDTEFPMFNTVSGRLRANSLSVSFIIKPTSIPRNNDNTYMKWQIVYVPRSIETQSILACGYGTALVMPREEPEDISPLPLNQYVFQRYVAGSTLEFANFQSEKLVEFISPDIDYNNMDLENTALEFSKTQLSILNSSVLYRDVSYESYLNVLSKYKTTTSNMEKKWYNIEKALRLDCTDDYKPGVEATLERTAFFSGSSFVGDVCYYVPPSYNFGVNLNVMPVVSTYHRIDISDTTKNVQLFVRNNKYVRGVNSRISNMIKPFVISTTSSILDAEYDTGGFYCRIRRRTIPYGGQTYEDRLLNSYIPASNIGSNGTLYGDTYLGFYEKVRYGLTRLFRDVQWVGKDLEWGSILATQQHDFVDNGMSVEKEAASQSYTSSVLLPTETSVLLPYQHGFRMNRHFEEQTSRLILPTGNQKTITELVVTDATGHDDEYEKTEIINYDDMFLYNSVYSRVGDVKKYYIRPQIWDKNIVFPNRIRYSDIKYNGEVFNAWLNYRTNNMQDVDSKYGEIRQLVNWKNYLFAFQSRGFCMLPVNERATTTTTEGSPVVLGEGEILPRFFNYSQGSEKYGLQNDNKVLSTENGLYWIDVIEKKVLMFSGQTMELNFATGMSSWLRDVIDENTTYVAGYDNQFKEVLFSFIGSINVLVYSELLRAFQGFYTFETERFIEIPELLSVENSRYIWKHNNGVRASWYNTVNPSIFEIIVNDQPLVTKKFNDQSLVTKEFNNIEFMSESFTEATKVDNYYDTVNYIQSSNDYMESENIQMRIFHPNDVLYTGGLNIPISAPSRVKNIRRKQRMWRTTVPRVEETSLDIDNHRMRDAYVKLKFTYNNKHGYQFIMHPITTYYTINTLI